MEAQSGLCRGCYRTLDEIARWAGMSDLERDEVTRKLPGRRTGSSAAKTPPSQGVAASSAPEIMRTVGTRRQPAISGIPTTQALLRAATHVEAARVLAAVHTTGIAKGVYRFSTAEEASRHAEEALARVIVQNLRAREVR